ncbi:YSIRK-type signal peptide-containing protein, partial [Streptococcus suis]
MKYKYRGKKNTPLKEEKRTIKYGLKKLSVGVVSCIIGCCIFLGPGVSVYAQSSWDTSGNVALGDTASEVNEARHSVKVSTSIDEKNRTVTYTIYFNANHENWSRPGIDAFLPNVIDVNSINITRDYKENGGIWLQQGKENLVEFDQGRTRKAIWYTDTDNFNNGWNRIKDTGSDGTSELDKWKNEGKFSIYLHSWETYSTKQYKWTITAKLKEGLTALEVKEAPVVVGMSTWNRRWPRYVGTGPHDTDGDGYSDIRERYYGTDPENRDDQPTAAKLFDLRKPDQPVEVKDTNNLTPEEKEKVKDAIKAKNPTLSQDAKVEVGNDGTVTVTYSDQSTDELPGNEVVVEKPKTQAELNNVEKPDQPVEVKDTNNLTPEEKEKVKDAIKAKNPTLSQDAKVEVGN